jgi:3-oxoacyl-[acyl-carrier-protein] synthase II
MIRDGRADVVLAGGAEAVIHPLTVAAFEAMRALSRRNDEPELASRPFDRDRDGFVLGEGAAALVLEARGHAAARGAPEYAELAGVGVSSDAHDRVRPDPSGAGAARAIRSALDDAGASTRDVVHVCAHATSTPLGDLAEAVAIRSALGAAADGVVVSAPKSTVGHLLGAAGALGAAVTVLSVHERLVPPTANLTEQDGRVGLDVVVGAPRRLPARGTALTHSFGFGGHNVVLAFRSAGRRPHGEVLERQDPLVP